MESKSQYVLQAGFHSMGVDIRNKTLKQAVLPTKNIHNRAHCMLLSKCLKEYQIVVLFLWLKQHSQFDKEFFGAHKRNLWQTNSESCVSSNWNERCMDTEFILMIYSYIYTYSAQGSAETVTTYYGQITEIRQRCWQYFINNMLLSDHPYLRTYNYAVFFVFNQKYVIKKFLAFFESLASRTSGLSRFFFSCNEMNILANYPQLRC